MSEGKVDTVNETEPDMAFFDAEVATPFLRSPFNYDREMASELSGLDCRDASRTVQDGREEADINTIVARFGLTGKLPTAVRMPQFGDFEGIFDYQSALNAVIAAEAAFMQMPANVRSRFHNDPGALVEFAGNPANRDEAVKLGLIDLPVVAPVVAPVVENATPE